MECPICLGPLNNCPDGIEDNVRRRLNKIKTATCCCTPCGHIFHKACLLTWLDQGTRPPCPVCNEKLTKMKLYPAYLNVDKESGTSGGGGAGGVDGRQPSVGPQVVTSMWTGGGGGRTMSTTATATVTLPICPPVICSRPGCNHQGASGLTMTIGTYALTTFGQHPLVTAAAAGSPLGATIPRAHQQLLGNLGFGNASAFVAFPQTSLATVPMSISVPVLSATTTISTGRQEAGRASGDEAVLETRNSAASAANMEPTMEPQLETRRGGTGGNSGTIPGRVGRFSPATQPRSMCPWEYYSNSAYGGSGNGMGSAVGNINYRVGGVGGGGGQPRYCPYPQPPPAHVTSLSLPRRISNILESVNRAANNGAAVGVQRETGGAGREMGGRQVAPPRMYVRTPPNIHEYQIQSEP